MYAALYVTSAGFSSVGYIGEFEGDAICIADPVFGWQDVAADECFAVVHTETGHVLPGVIPALSASLASDWLLPERRMAANKVIRGPWHAKRTVLESELGDKFVSGYPHAWERIRRWTFDVAPDWRSLALSAIFARISIQRPIEEAERLYRLFGPTLRDALLRGHTPTAAQMVGWRGIKGTRAEYGSGGLDDLRSMEDILEWAPWCGDILRSTEDISRRVRDTVAVEWLPWGIGIAKLSFTMMLSGRDAACLDTRMLNHFLGAEDPGATDFAPAQYAPQDHYGDDYASNPRKKKGAKKRVSGQGRSPRLAFLGAVSKRSTRKGARGITRNAVDTYVSLEDKLANTPYFDPDWPQPYARAQWMLWETLGRTAGTANHGALWQVIDPLIEEITGPL